MFELIPGGKKEKPNYVVLYCDAMLRTLERLKEAPADNQAKLRAIFYGVKLIGVTDNRNLTEEEAERRFWMINSTQAMMKAITPIELMQMFPVKKAYDGQRGDCKDYFFTMDVLRQHGLDKPLGEAVNEILWDYMNQNIMAFVVASLAVMDELRRHNGEKSMFQEFMDEQGVKLPTYRMEKDSKGRRWMINNETGERNRVKVKRAKHLRAVSSI
ncbi:hypothetical protein [Anaeromusa sp.]|uniref:hypothetical protein n=1 Tax=Anaeromusa sp. TaxID=1872520 RepID=UPI0026399A07|nr:hypothetical protein [Anaeromusa sp.]MDD3158614.1 hypothetical protein [Anaeromusa sp.]